MQLQKPMLSTQLLRKDVRLCSRFDLRGRYSQQKKPTPANTDKSAVLYLYNSAINEPPPYMN